jgi:phytoene desaturase
MPCLQTDYAGITDYLTTTFLSALPRMSLGRSVFGNLGRYFDEDDLKLCFSFQSKYLGMSPWSCPAFFTMLSYIEHAFGIYHVTGGLNQISRAMADIVREDGGEVRLTTPVEQLILEDGRAAGLRLEDGSEERFDYVVLNSDFGHAMCNLVPTEHLRRYSPEKLKKWKLSCSTFMLYLGVDREYPDLPHHNIIFADDYRRNLEEITSEKVLPSDPSFYVQNASVTDPTLAPEGKSTIYVLVPVPNRRAGIDWDAQRDAFADRILDILENQGFQDLRGHIEQQHVVTPAEWETDYNVYEGATFNLAHTLMQLLYFRPHNRFEEIDNCFLVGGGTHPGSGLPTIYESGRISSNLLCSDLGIPYEPPGTPLPDSMQTDPS